ncbi:diguanylate cyclase/phosphodiesterase [Pseudomonas chlororaphis]|uniref:EAL domain-containing protein n=1 Tax=Pseudomonas chlororaphis TaxID=587753 RepID=UPI000F5839F5|nr:EAL domain-containing protein [Pseudomonas chlororaphis]AZD11522.1 diguanylate cyclase/phosphodiesterase [Pseudomonas chlororaphis]
MSIAFSTQFPDGESRCSPRLAAAAQEPDAIDIRRGLRRGEFQAYVQPKFDLQSQAVQGVEVLARWQHSQRGLMTPAAFISLMTREQLLDELLSSLLAQGLACQVELHRQGRELSFAFNLSLHQLASDSLVDQLAARLQQHPLPLSSVILEITEDAFTSVSPAVLQRLVCLKELGIRLSMDDFGMGYSSLWRLNQLPFDEIKLAGEFTAQLEDSPRARAIVRHALFLAEDLGMQLIVEGIETQSQRSLLMQLGACFGQGYLYAEPMPVDSLDAWLKRSQQPF